MERVMKKQDRRWIQGIDSLRFILAIWVVLGHHPGLKEVLTLWLDDEQPLVQYLIALSGNLFVGVAAVIIFFIISGIVIHFPYRHGKELHLLDFLIKRYLRILLPMVAIIAISIPMDFSNPVLWSLYCELIYYTIYPLLLIQIRKKGVNRWITVSAVAAAIIVFTDGHTLQSFIHQIPPTQGYYGNFMYHGVAFTWLIGLPSWLLGVKIAQNFEAITQTNISQLRIIVLRSSVFLFSVICSIARFHFSLSYTISLSLFAILGFYWISGEIAYLQRKKCCPWLEAGGKWSYSIYLTHMVVFFALPSVISGLPPYWQWPIGILSVLSFAYAFYLIVEKPSHILARKVNKHIFLVSKKIS